MSYPWWKSSDNKFERVLFSLLLVLACYTMPIWLFGGLCVIGIALFTDYYEVPLLWCILELVFGVPTVSWSPFMFIGTISMLLIILIAEAIKRQVFVT